MVLSDELYFRALFPEEPKRSEGPIDTSFGTGFEQRWTLELSNMSYEVSVIELPDITVKVDGKSLNRFYDLLTDDLGKQYGVKFGYHTVEHFGELGRLAGRSTLAQSVIVEMFLIRKHLYKATIIWDSNPLNNKRISKDNERFLDNFLFVLKRGNEEKYSYGLPKFFSQNISEQ